MPSYPETWFPVLVQILIAVAVAGAMIGLSAILGQRLRDSVGNARERFSVKFYLVGMVFILFDIEAIFLYPWAVVYRRLGLFGFYEMLLFIALVLTGYFYIWKKGVLNWASDNVSKPVRRETKRAA
jgi:NADH-quinone oxidoreductase subunit A